MRHRKKINSLGRKAAHRKETMSSMACALILHKRINTTVAKAKALRVYVEPLITRSKNDSTHSRRMVFSYLGNKHAVSELFREVSQKVADRPGGYTRILKTGFRKGDAAEMCFIELVDYNTAMLTASEETTQKRTRRGRRSGKKAESATEAKGEQTAKAVETAPEAPVETSEPVEEQASAEPVSDQKEVEAASPDAEVKAEETEKVAEAKAEESEEKVEEQSGEKETGEGDQAGEKTEGK